MATTYLCPSCGRQRPAVEHFEQGYPMLRCDPCGYPIDRRHAEVDGVPIMQPTILFVDDDPLLLGLFARCAVTHGFVPLLAGDGPSGLELARRSAPAVILLEAALPGLDGVELCRRLRIEPALKTTAIIVLTLGQDPALRVKAFQAGATLAMAKPADPDQLFRVVRTSLGLSRAAPPACETPEPERSARF